MALSRRDGSARSNSSSIFDPFSRLESMFEPFELFESFPARSFAREANAMAGTRVDWQETKDSHVFKADLPGLKKDEIKVQLQDDRVLEISGERAKEEEVKTDTWHRVERSHGQFLRRFRLPDNVRTDQMTAKVENGVLTVTVPKVQQPAPDVRTIDIA